VKRMVFASHTASIGVFRVGSHHLSRELSRMGNDVVHVSTPVSLAHLAKVRDPVVRSRLDASRHRRDRFHLDCGGRISASPSARGRPAPAQRPTSCSSISRSWST
jgi:hypothetical protein